MDVAIDTSGMDCYEDMFKEITRKLYGEEGMQQSATGHSVIAGVFNGVINETVLVNRMSEYESFDDGSTGSEATKHTSSNGVIVGTIPVGEAAAYIVQEAFQQEQDSPDQQQQQQQHEQQQHHQQELQQQEQQHHQQELQHQEQQHQQQVMMSDHYSSDLTGSDAVDPNAPDTWYMTDEALEWTTSKIASYNPAQKLFRCIDCECCGFLARVAEHWLGTHANLRVFQCPHCPYASAWARCVRMHLARQHNAPEQNTLWKESPVLSEVTRYLSRLRARVEAGPDGSPLPGPGTATGLAAGDHATQTSPEREAEQQHYMTPSTPPTTPGVVVSNPEPAAPGASNKRYSCSVCPYSTDRRDLYTRHEAIHSAEKPFHCYRCQKQFNRADHVKKHFLRMHRGLPYDLNRIRRRGTATPTPSAAPASAAAPAAPAAPAASTMSYYKFNNAAAATATADAGAVNGVEVQQQRQQIQLQQQQQQQIILQTSQPLHHQQPQQQQQQLNIPSMATYQATLAGRLVGNGHVLKSVSPVQQQQQHQQAGGAQQAVAQHMAGQMVGQMAGQMTSVITDATKVVAATLPAGPAAVVSVGVAEQATGVGAEGGGDSQEVPRTKGGKEKRYPCPYCSWSGVDNWCLKRHLNTHLKPFVCGLCDYKAARTERLQTHVLKVHNKRSCGRCNFMADDAAQLSLHMQEHHGQLTVDQPSPLPRQKRVGRKAPAWSEGSGAVGVQLVSAATAPGPMYETAAPVPAMHQVVRRTPKRWRPKPVGAERLFNYMEASDSEDDDEEPLDDLVCHDCGIEFVNIVGLQAHMTTHHSLGLLCSGTQQAVMEVRCAEPGCRYVTGLHNALEEHVRLAHPSLPPLSQKCPHCGFVVLSATALTRHQKTHHLMSVACASCTRVLGRFDRHKNGEMWTDEDDVDEDDDVSSGLQNPGGDEADEVLLGEPRVVAVPAAESGEMAQDPERRAALQALRVKARARRRCVLRYRRARVAAKRKLAIGVESGRREALKYKYLRRMVSARRLACYACLPELRLAIPVHTAASLRLHALWRHAHVAFPCDSCDARFRHRHQVLLHVSREHAVAEPIVTLSVPQIITHHQLTQMTALDPHQLQIESDLQQLQPQFVTHDVFQAQTAADGTAAVSHEETYTIDSTRLTVSVPVLYEQQQLSQEQHQDEQQFHGTMYNSMMVPKQVWYPQLTTTPAYYISTQFPST